MKKGDTKGDLIYKGIVLAFIIIQSIYILITQPDKFKPWISVFYIFIGIIMTIMAVIFYFDANKPKIGPVGNGPNHDLILTNFLVMIFTGGSLIIIGIIGVHIKRKLKNKK
ncbi:hypothetical protein [Bacillus sp. FJAT-28004]|uniref:hypothetical protein n=1 Tax=Bacillus sp. FJAT-28004 TaxID=1679165 RepID=UPI0006B4DF8B|nr:hypothetical protein [Bacillus sp. FJAT-28004]